MTRRTLRLLVAFSLGLLVVSRAVAAQLPPKVPRVGLLSPGSQASFVPRIDALRQGLWDLGYVEGQSIVLEPRWAAGRFEQMPALAAELVGLPVDIILTWGAPAARAAQQATATIPIVMVNVGDAVAAGLVASFARPGGNITGFSYLMPELLTKRLELLKEALPGLTRVAVLWNPANPAHAPALPGVDIAAGALGLQLQRVPVREPGELDSAFAAMTTGGAGALVVFDDGMFVYHRARIASLARDGRLPTMYGTRDELEAGGLMFYGVSLTDLARRAALFVDKILKGAKPADLPVEQPTTFEFVINLKTAQALGLTIPPTLLFQATEVIR